MSSSKKQTRVILGMDVSKNKLDIACLPGKQTFQVENEQHAIRQFIRESSKTLLKDKASVIIVMEYTGGYEQEVARQLEAQGYGVHIAHPTRIYHFAKQKGYFGKTDKIDRWIIAEYGEQENVKPHGLLSVVDEKLRSLYYRRQQLIDHKHSEECRFQKNNNCKEIRSSLKRSMKQLASEIDRIDLSIKQLIEGNREKKEKVERLQTCPGIGPVISQGLVSLVPELGSLSRSQIACLIGVAPRNNDSGQKRGKRMISGGRFYARKLLYMGALVAIRFNPRLRAFYQSLREKGKLAKVAIVAVMRKLIIALNSMIRKEACWQDMRV